MNFEVGKIKSNRTTDNLCYFRLKAKSVQSLVNGFTNIQVMEKRIEEYLFLM